MDTIRSLCVNSAVTTGLTHFTAFGANKTTVLEVNNINYLVVHCSDTPDNDPLTARDIHEMHLGFGGTVLVITG